MSTLLTELERIEARAEKATKGPWFFRENSLNVCGKDGHTFIKVLNDREADARFVVLARTDIPRLCAVVRKLVEQRNDYLDELGCERGYLIDDKQRHREACDAEAAALLAGRGEG